MEEISIRVVSSVGLGLRLMGGVRFRKWRIVNPMIAILPIPTAMPATAIVVVLSGR